MAADEGKFTLTPEEQRVEEFLKEATLRINEIDYKINNPDGFIEKPSDPRPSWMTSMNRPYQREVFIKNQEAYRKEFKEYVRGETAKHVEKSPLDTQLKAFAMTDAWAERHTTDKEREEASKEQGKHGISKSQDVSMRLLNNHHLETTNSGTYKPSYLTPPGQDDPNPPGGGYSKEDIDDPSPGKD